MSSRKNRSKQNTVGNQTEKFVAKTMKQKGYWAHIVAKNSDGGQPCDIIAAKSNQVWLIDAKHVDESKVSFTFDRVEPNQVSSMQYATDFAHISHCGFAIYFERNKQLYWLPYWTYRNNIALGLKSVNMNDLSTLDEVLCYEDNYKQ